MIAENVVRLSEVKGIGPPPPRLAEDEQRAWDDIVRACPPNVLLPIDRIFLEVTATSLARHRLHGVPGKHMMKSMLRQYFIVREAAEKLMLDAP